MNGCFEHLKQVPRKKLLVEFNLTYLILAFFYRDIFLNFGSVLEDILDVDTLSRKVVCPLYKTVNGVTS